MKRFVAKMMTAVMLTLSVTAALPQTVEVRAEEGTDQKVLEITFDEEDAQDSSGNENHGTIVGSPEFVDGVSGKAIHIVNEDTGDHVDAHQYVNFGKDESLQFGTDDFTIMFWYKADAAQTEEVAVVSNKDWYSGANVGFTIGDMRNGMTLNFRADGSSGRVDTSRYAGATEDSWHHITAVFDRDASMMLYVDGAAVESADISAQAGLSIDTGYDFVLGANGIGQNGARDSYIDELVVYKRALSAEEIAEYNGPSVLKNKIAEYEALLELSDASDEKKAAFGEVIAEVKVQLETASGLEKITELTERLQAAYNDFIGPEDGIISFEVISDTHIPGTDNTNATNQKLIDALEDMKRDYPDIAAVINCGDFSGDGYEAQVQGYFSILEDYKDQFTFLTALGNHDVRWKSGWNEVYERYMSYNQEYMGDTDGRVYYDKWIGGYHFIVLNTEWDIKDCAYLSPQQLTWLEEKLAENAEPDKPIFIVLHQALKDTYENSNDWSVGVQDYQLKEVLRKYPQSVIFTGHIHDGLGAIEVTNTDYGIQVDVPSLKDNDYGDGRGQLGFHVTVYEDQLRLDLRDYLNNEWVSDYSYSFSLNPEDRPAGKVLEVNFDDESAADISGNGNDGTLGGEPEFVDDENGGKALHIVNSDSVAGVAQKAEQYVDFGENILLGEEDFTILFSYKGEPAQSSDGCVIGNKNWNSGANPGFAIGIFGSTNSGIGLNLNTEGNSRSDTSRYSAAADGQWHEIAAVFDRDGEMTLYIDGAAAGSKDISSHTGESADVEGMKLVLGADGNYQNSVHDMYIDNLKVYKTALGAAEIETTYVPYKASVTFDSVTISWDDTEGTTEPAYLTVAGEKKTEIASGATSATVDGLMPNTTYTVTLVTHQKSNSNNYQDVYPFVVTTEQKTYTKEELETLYQQNQDREEAEYTEETWERFAQALSQAETVLAKEDPSLVEIQTAGEELASAVAGLVKKPGMEDISYTQNDFNITITNDVLTEDDGTNVSRMIQQGNYNGLFNGSKGDSSSRDFEFTWDIESNYVNGALPDYVTLPATLHFALKEPGLLNQISLYNANKANGYLTSAKAVVTYADGTTKEQTIRTESAVYTFTFLSDKNVMNVDVTALTAVKSNGTAVTNMLTLSEIELGYFTALTVSEADKAELLALAETACELEEADYTAESWTDFPAALNMALDVLENELAEQTEVDAAKEALQAAIDALVEVEEPTPGDDVDKTALVAMIAQAEELEEADYTEESWAVLTAALDTAKEINDKDDATLAEVAQATAALDAAIKALVEKEEPDVPTEEVCQIFKDVTHGSWYEEAVQYVYDKGLMEGNADKFTPNGQMTRGMFVLTLYRLAGEPEITDDKALTELNDVAEGAWYADAVCWAYATGVTTGYESDMTFRTNVALSREQLATFLYRYTQYQGLDVSASDDLEGLLNADKVKPYAEKEVKWAVGAGMISGMEVKDEAGETVYDLAPQKTATRAQMAQILARFCEAYDL